MIAPARIAAYETILAVAAGRADLPSSLARARTRLKDERDRALAGEIATGTLRWQGAFDHVIAAFAGRPTARLDAEVLAILRISMFQLLHLDRVPAAAVVNDAVELAGKAGKRSAAGFVNALLRRVSRERAQLPLPAAPPIDLLAVTLSHPRWLAERWLARHGFDAAEAWARFDNSPAPLTLRANTLRTTRDALTKDLEQAGVATQPARFAPDGLIVTSGNPLLTPLAHSGAFFVQDETSQLVGAFVAAAAGERILDACASPGGKTTQMAAAMGDTGTIVAADVRGRRLELLARTIAESGARQVRIVQANARAVPPFGEVFDAVLVDAPCSGLGTIRRDPDIRWRRTEADLEPLAQAQGEMLGQLACVVRPGGRLVYSTCSSEPEENEAIVDAFLAAHPRFRRARPAPFDRRPELAALLDGQGALKTLPFRDGLEAFYAALLVRDLFRLKAEATGKRPIPDPRPPTSAKLRGYMALSTRVWGAGKRVLLGGALVLTYLIFAAAAMRLALKTRDVVVPPLTGKTVAQAGAALAPAGLNLKVEETRRADASIPAGTVISQDPQSGVKTRRERSVKVWVSAGPRATAVPALVGESERTAQLRAQQDGLQLASIAEIRSADYTAGTVVAQNPPAQKAMPTGGRVTLLVNRGERGDTYVMPDLIGVNGDRAADLLRSRGFRVSVVGDHPYPGVPAGIVLRQSPQGGFQFGTGDPISLEVSR